MNPMRIIGASNNDIKSVNRVTYVIDTDEVVAYVNKSTLLGRYPNLYYAYEAVRGAMMRCGCKDMIDVITKPVDVITTQNTTTTGNTFFSTPLNEVASSGGSFNYATAQLRFEGIQTIPWVFFLLFDVPPQVRIAYKIDPASITAPATPTAALAAGFQYINSGDPILFPTGNGTNNRWFIRIAPMWDETTTFTVPSFTVSLRAAIRPAVVFSSTTINFS
jgi:hypothetical protein